MEKSDRTIRVVVADDHELYRRHLCQLLEAEGDFTVVGEAVNGIEAVQHASQLGPDVVVMDVVMPELAGIAATQRIVSAHPEVRVLGLSLHQEPQLVGGMIEAGAIGYVRKDDDPEHIVKAIREAAAGRRFLSSALRRERTN